MFDSGVAFGAGFVRRKKGGKGMMKLLYGVLIIAAVGLTTAFGQRADDKCVAGAWVFDKELYKDTWIRDSPEWVAKGIGEVPSAMDEGDETIIGITGSKNGWLRIQRAVALNDEVLFDGIGWLRDIRVMTATYSATGGKVAIFSKPSRTSKRVARLPAGTRVDVLAHDCFGLKVKYRRTIGWLAAEDICANPVTLCGLKQR